MFIPIALAVIVVVPYKIAKSFIRLIIYCVKSLFSLFSLRNIKRLCCGCYRAVRSLTKDDWFKIIVLVLLVGIVMQNYAMTQEFQEAEAKYREKIAFLEDRVRV